MGQRAVAAAGPGADRCGRAQTVLPTAGLFRHRHPGGDGVHEIIHRQPHVEDGADLEHVGTAPAGWGPRDTPVRGSHADFGFFGFPAHLFRGR